MKFKIITTTLLLSSFILGQEAISNNLNTAVVKFQSTGINDMENQAFFEYFLQELNNASQNNFIDQKSINQNTKSLELSTSSCFTNDCLKAAMDSTNSDELITGTIQFSKNKFRVKMHKIESPDPATSHGQRGAGEGALLPFPAAIANAIHDATGVRFRELPLSPQKILPSLIDHGFSTHKKS